jgi:hypothetical protein
MPTVRNQLHFSNSTAKKNYFENFLLTPSSRLF